MPIGDCLSCRENIKRARHSHLLVSFAAARAEAKGLYGMHEAKRFEIRCPVTVQVANGQSHKVKVQGVLYDIGVDGARVALEQPVPPGTKITLFAHFRSPDEQVTTIRFEGIVQRLQEEPRFQIAVNFQGTGRFLQRQIVDLQAMKTANGDEAS
jgi:hypothetical protein